MSWDKGIDAATRLFVSEWDMRPSAEQEEWLEDMGDAVSAFLGEQPTIQWCAEHQCGDVPEVNVSCIVGTSRDEHERCQIVGCRLVEVPVAEQGDD